MAIELYDYQHLAVEKLRQNIREHCTNQVLCAATGSGKTEVALYLIQEALHRNKRALFVCDRTAIVSQSSERMDKYGIDHGVIMADHWRWRPWSKVQVCSAQTIARRSWPDTDLIVVDEAHSLYRTITHRIDKRDVTVIGLTATPFTRGLGKHYDRIVSVTTTHKLIERGFLAPYRIFAASTPDMTGAKTVAGEWTDDVAAERSMPIIGDVVAEYLKWCNGQKFICFGSTVAHCEALQRQFMQAGVMCGLYTYHTGDEERAQLLQDFAERDGYLRGLISVSALAKGFDSPAVECIIFARPLRKSLAEHIQMWGRGLRFDAGNPTKVCTILDHAGNVERMWSQTIDFFENGWHTLDDGTRKERATKPDKEREPMKCPRCAAVHVPRMTCPACGYEYPARKNRLTHKAGELQEFLGISGTSESARRDLYAQLLYIANERKYASGWASHLVKEKTGAWPSRIMPAPMEPTPEVLRWVRHRLIKYAKGKEKAKARA